jgi:hypothetical protein
MNQVIGMILEMVFTALLVCFLFAYLLKGYGIGGAGLWEQMGTIGTSSAGEQEYVMDEQTYAVITASAAVLSCPLEQISLNHVYELSELFVNESPGACYLELSDVLLGEESVLAKGDIVSLALAEMPAAVLYDEETGQVLFTAAGRFRAVVRVGTVYGQRARKEVWITIPAVSEYVLENGGAGGGGI